MRSPRRRRRSCSARATAGPSSSKSLAARATNGAAARSRPRSAAAASCKCTITSTARRCSNGSFQARRSSRSCTKVATTRRPRSSPRYCGECRPAIRPSRARRSRRGVSGSSATSRRPTLRFRASSSSTHSACTRSSRRHSASPRYCTGICSTTTCCVTSGAAGSRSMRKGVIGELEYEIGAALRNPLRAAGAARVARCDRTAARDLLRRARHRRRSRACLGVRAGRAFGGLERRGPARRRREQSGAAARARDRAVERVPCGLRRVSAMTTAEALMRVVRRRGTCP